MNVHFSVRTLQLGCLIAVVSYLVLGQWTWSSVLAAFAVYAFFLTLGVAIGLHRGLSHRLVETHSKLAWVSLGVGTLASLGRPVEWALIHRMHHQHSDEETDPHSPKWQGFWRVFFNSWRLPRRTKSPGLGLIRDLVKAPAVQFYQKHYYLVILGYASALAGLFGVSGVIFGYCWPVVLCVLATSLVNACCHRSGEARDLFWVNLFTFGEGVHGRHHREPKTVNLSHGVYFDLSGWLLAKWNSSGEEGVVWALSKKKWK